MILVLFFSAVSLCCSVDTDSEKKNNTLFCIQCERNCCDQIFVNRHSLLMCTFFQVLTPTCTITPRSSRILQRSASLQTILWYRLTVVLLDCRHPRFWNFNSALPVDIVRVKSNLNVNGFLYPTGVPMWVSVNKFNLVPKRIMSELVSMF